MRPSLKGILAVLILGPLALFILVTQSGEGELNGSLVSGETRSATASYVQKKNLFLSRVAISPATISKKNKKIIYRYSLINRNPDFAVTGFIFQTRTYSKDGSVVDAGDRDIGMRFTDAGNPSFFSCQPSTTCPNAVEIEVHPDLHKQGPRIELTVKDIRGVPSSPGVYLEMSDVSRSIFLNGEINADLIGDIRHALATGPASTVTTVHITSPGGDVNAAMKIGRMLRKANASVTVGNVCASACVLVLGSGISRSVWAAQVGIHRPYFTEHGPQAKYSDVQARIRAANKELRDYFEEMNLPLSLLDAMNAVPSEQTKWLTEEEISHYQLNQMDPVAKELRDDQEARRWRISRAELYRRERLADDKCDVLQYAGSLQDILRQADNCRNRIMTAGR